MSDELRDGTRLNMKALEVLAQDWKTRAEEFERQVARITQDLAAANARIARAVELASELAKDDWRGNKPHYIIVANSIVAILSEPTEETNNGA